MVDRCDDCGKKSLYVLEWWGVNQYGENPEVVLELGSCGNFEHMLNASTIGSNDLDVLDEIYNTKDYAQHPELSRLVNQAFRQKNLDRELYQRGQRLIDNFLTPNQLTLF